MWKPVDGLGKGASARGQERMVTRDPERATAAVQEALAHAWRDLPSGLREHHPDPGMTLLGAIAGGVVIATVLWLPPETPVTLFGWQ